MQNKHLWHSKTQKYILWSYRIKSLHFFFTINIQFIFSRDTAGQERFHSITTAYYRGAKVSFNISIH